MHNYTKTQPIERKFHSVFNLSIGHKQKLNLIKNNIIIQCHLIKNNNNIQSTESGTLKILTDIFQNTNYTTKFNSHKYTNKISKFLF